MNASQSERLISLVGRLHPEAFDALKPYGPGVRPSAGRGGIFGRFDEVALNPQPIAPGVQLRMAVQDTARAVADAAIAAQFAGRDPGDVLREVGDDWCATPPGRRIPWPRQWPFPWPPGEPYPIDTKAMAPAVQAQAGLLFQSYATGVGDEKLSSAFGELADRLIDAALEPSDVR